MSIQKFIAEEHDVRHPLHLEGMKTPVTQDSRTHQSFRDETTIQSIYERFTRTGTLEVESRRARAQYGDVSHLNEDLTVLHSRASETHAELNEFVKAEKKKKAEPKKITDAPQGVPAPAPAAPPEPPTQV